MINQTNFDLSLPVEQRVQAKLAIKDEYTLKNINSPIGVATYKLRNTLPDDMKAMLPDPEEIAKRLKLFEE